MGGGDLKLGAMLGAFLGWKALIVALFVAIVLGGTIGAVLLVAFMYAVITFASWLGSTLWLAFWAARRLPGRAVPGYLASQCAGALLAIIVPIVTPGLLICQALGVSARDTNLIVSMSLVISGITAMLVYLALHYLLVRPMRRVTANLMRFRAAPENPASAIAPLKRAVRADTGCEARRATSGIEYALATV